ncbi:MAG: hypothetical protein PHU85_12680, partial [Phycisphaerae bacterium]|nr:hypothetical protein [Phycisphaerae bacterium]
LFPVGIGFAVGFAGSKVTTKSKVRSPLIGGLLGFVCGVAAILCMHYFDYRSYLDEMQKGEIARIIKMSDAEFESGIAEVAAEDQRVLRLTRTAVRKGTFAAYMDLQAEFGVELKRTASSSKSGGMNLGYIGSFIYWIVEVLIVAGIAFVLVRSAASEPFCGQCNQWRVAQPLGAVNDDGVAAIAAGNMPALSAAMATGLPARLPVGAYVCPGCGVAGDVDVKVVRQTVNKKGEKSTEVLAFVTYPPNSVEQLAASLNTPPATAGEPDAAAETPQA